MCSRVPTVEEVDRHTQAFMKKYPRSSFSELKAHPVNDPDVFEQWARESHQVAVDWAFDVKMVTDPDKYQSQRSGGQENGEFHHQRGGTG